MELPDVYKEIEAITDKTTALKIAELFEGTQVYFPKLSDAFKREERNKRIREDYLQGSTISNIAKKYKLSEKCVRDILFKRR